MRKIEVILIVINLQNNEPDPTYYYFLYQFVEISCFELQAVFCGFRHCSEKLKSDHRYLSP